MSHRVEDIRNVAVCGHGSSGKTTLIDRMLVESGAVSGTPSVDAGTSICDFDEEEKHHKHTVEAAIVHCEHNGKQLNIVDTPGYPDFIGQTVGALRGADTAVIVVNAHRGVEVNTRRTFDEAGKAGLGRIICINHMDDENIEFEMLVEEIKDVFSNHCVLLNVPLGSGESFRGVASTLHPPEDASGALVDPQEIHGPLVESIIEVDDEMMEKFFAGDLPTEEQMSHLIVRAVAEGTLIPIVCTSGKTGVGVKELLGAISICGLSPLDKPYTASKSGEETEISPDPDGPLIAQVFKTRSDPFVQKLSYLRVFSGKLKKDDTVHASSARKDVKVHQLLKVQGGETEPIDEAIAGDIVAVAKQDDFHTGTSLGDYEMPAIRFPKPMVSLAVMPKERGDEGKMSVALHKVLEEDPTFRLKPDPQTHEMVISGMSELHLNIIRERLLRRDNLEIATADPKIPYRETIQMPAEGMYRHKKQSGGRGQFGEVHIRMFPMSRDDNPEEFANKQRFPHLRSTHFDDEHHFLWIDSIVGGTIPGNFMPAVEKGFLDRLNRGVIAGYPVQDVCVEVHFGKYHSVDSSEAAFKTAASMAFKEVFLKAKPALLEPVVKLDITVPESSVGDIYSDMSQRGGRVNGADALGGGFQIVHAEAPLREVSTYNRSLSSITGGQGSYSMELSHYEVMPPNIQQEITSSAKMHEDEDH